jgi:hypothetical protein
MTEEIKYNKNEKCVPYEQLAETPQQTITRLEQEFFRVFGLEPFCDLPCNKRGVECTDNTYCGNKYPDITSEKLLKMICILNETACEVLAAENIEDLKNEILETCIKVYNTPILTSDGDEYDNYAIYDKIQQLFKEEA